MTFAGRTGNMSFEDWFGLLQEPGDIIKSTGVVRGKNSVGNETLFEIKILGDESPPCRAYYAVRKGDLAVMIMMMSPSFDITQNNAGAFETLIASMQWESDDTTP